MDERTQRSVWRNEPNQSGLRETVGMTANHGLQENPFHCFRPVIYNRKTNQNV
jgi:hypothetical protein